MVGYLRVVSAKGGGVLDQAGRLLGYSFTSTVPTKSTTDVHGLLIAYQNLHNARYHVSIEFIVAIQF